MRTKRVKIGTLLSIGIPSFAVGLGVMLLPLQVPTLSVHAWFICYWCGGALAIVGGLLVDLAVLRTVARLLATAGRARLAIRAIAATATSAR